MNLRMRLLDPRYKIVFEDGEPHVYSRIWWFKTWSRLHRLRCRECRR